MRWSWRLARFNGAPVAVRWLFALLLAWAAYVGWGQGHVLGILYATGLLLATFGCNLLEEMGHALQAQAIGIPVRRIVLLPYCEPVAVSLLLCGKAAVLGAGALESFEQNQVAVQGTPVRAAVRPPTWTMQLAEAQTSVLLKAVESLNESARPVVGETRLVGLLTNRESTAAGARTGWGLSAASCAAFSNTGWPTPVYGAPSKSCFAPAKMPCPRCIARACTAG